MSANSLGIGHDRQNVGLYLDDGSKLFGTHVVFLKEFFLSYDVAAESEITPCNKIDKPLVGYRYMGNVMTSITMLRT